MLDVPSITFLSTYLQSYPSTVLVVSHDRAFLNEVATDIIHQHSERLDYYRGANFGTLVHCGLIDKLLMNARFVLCDKGRTTQGCEARIRESDGSAGTLARY